MDYLQYEDIKNNIKDRIAVLNLIINGLPSISYSLFVRLVKGFSFKPYYKWITFNINN